MKRFQAIAALTTLIVLAWWLVVPSPRNVAHAQVAGRPVNGPTTRAQLVSPWQHGYAWLVTDCEASAACDTGGGDFPKILIYNANTPGWEIASGAGGGGGTPATIMTFLTATGTTLIATDDGTGSHNAEEAGGYGCGFRPFGATLYETDDPLNEAAYGTLTIGLSTPWPITVTVGEANDYTLLVNCGAGPAGATGPTGPAGADGSALDIAALTAQADPDDADLMIFERDSDAALRKITVGELKTEVQDGTGTDDQTAAEVPNTPAGSIAATDVQAALNELDTEKQPADADLTTYAGITPSANVQTMLGSANNAAIRSNIGVSSKTHHVCDIAVGDTSGDPITDAQLGPQKRICFVPQASTVVEVNVAADDGTPSAIVAKNCAGSVANLVSSALATAASGGIACSNAAGTTGLDGATTCTNTLQNTAAAAGCYFELVSGTAGGTAAFWTGHIVYTTP